MEDSSSHWTLWSWLEEKSLISNSNATALHMHHRRKCWSHPIIHNHQVSMILSLSAIWGKLNAPSLPFSNKKAMTLSHIHTWRWYPQELFRRIQSLVTAMRDRGRKDNNGEWFKNKFLQTIVSMTRLLELVSGSVFHVNVSIKSCIHVRSCKRYDAALYPL